MTLSPCAADIEEMPAGIPTVHGHIKYMLGDPHGLDARMEDVLCVAK